MNQQTIEQLWSSLDDLASRDPQEYKRYVESLKKQADIDSRAIKPGYFIKAQTSNRARHVLNVCHSKAVEGSADNYNIPTLMSEQREVIDDEGIIYVYDAVFNPNIFSQKTIEKDVRDLAVSCVFELFNVRLLASTFEVIQEQYFGPYGWDDSKGKALTTEELKNRKETQMSAGEIQNLLAQNVPAPPIPITVTPETVEEFQLKLPNEKEETKPLIQEIKKAKDWIIPDYSTKNTGDCLEVVVFLPDIESSKEIEYTQLEPGKFQIKAGEKYLLQHTIPDIYDCDNMNGKFVLAKRKLKMKFFKAPVAA
ncbi:PIH1 domain-containing protein 2 [Terramyces sp. JEL0728]|nr:PIH1 domain-containing protein 2 [Terramyces sp. JEL0728]